MSEDRPSYGSPAREATSPMPDHRCPEIGADTLPSKSIASAGLYTEAEARDAEDFGKRYDRHEVAVPLSKFGEEIRRLYAALTTEREVEGLPQTTGSAMTRTAARNRAKQLWGPTARVSKIPPPYITESDKGWFVTVPADPKGVGLARVEQGHELRENGHTGCHIECEDLERLIGPAEI